MTVREKYGPVRKIGVQSRSITGKVPYGSRYESGLERDLYELVRDEPDFESYHFQPLRVKYAYLGKEEEYTPDALMFWTSERRPILAEVKYRADVAGRWREYRAKFRGAQAYAKVRGWDWRIYTEDRIRTPRLPNLRFLHGYKAYPAKPEVEALIYTCLRRGPASAGDLMRKVSGRRLDAPDVVSEIWRLVALRKVQVDMQTPITMASILSTAT